MTKKTDKPGAAVRMRVMKRDRFRCTYCGTPGTDAELEVDHIIPVAHGGSNHISNLTTACRRCNQSKGAEIMPLSANHDKPSGLVGLCLLTVSKGKIQYQGQIIGTHEDYALVLRYSWFDGSTTDVMPLKICDVLNPEKCVLYPDHETMNSASRRHSRSDSYSKHLMNSTEYDHLKPLKEIEQEITNQKIIDLKREHPELSYREIAAKAGTNHTRVRRVLKRLEPEQGSIANNKTGEQ